MLCNVLIGCVYDIRETVVTAKQRFRLENLRKSLALTGRTATAHL